MSNALIQLIVLAAVAIFLILRLKSVLGTRDGFERPAKPMPMPADRGPARDFEVIEGGPDPDIIDHVDENSPAAEALAAMKRTEPGFSVGDFLKGARGAYEMILMAFEKGELDGVRRFLGPEVLEAFEQVVNARAEQGLKVESEFLGLRELTLEDASFTPADGLAEITVRFQGELVSVVRDVEGNVVEGDPKAVRKQRDIWTFARRMGASDPNWQLVATGG